MTIDTSSEFDIGPLSWVQGEIDQAFARALEALAAFKASPADATALKHARAHVHQAAGAIQMVGLDAVTAYTDELERQLTRLEEFPADKVQDTCDLVDHACRKLRIFLDELVVGTSPVPLKLFPEYEAMQQARGVKATAPTDLFYPDLSPRAPKIATVKSVTKLPSFLIKQRRLFQRGLLAWLRGDQQGAESMREAIQGIEDVQTRSAQRSFWWTVGALLESLVEKGVEVSLGVKQLCGRIDLQIRRYVEGSNKVADRMRREVLYYVAISAPVGPQVQAVQRAFRLHGLIPTADVLSADVVRMQPLLRETHDLLASAKDLWLKLTGGRSENLPKLKQTLSQLRDKTAAIGETSLVKLASALAGRLDRLGTGAIPEALAMEYATALLLAESAIDNFATRSAEFPRQVDAMLERLEAAAQNKSMTGAAAAPLLDEMARRAQERLLLAQVAREIQANLRHMEQALDAFFRDHSKRGDLAGLSRDSAQIAGALRMLGLEDAERLLALCQEQIDEYAKPDTGVIDEDLELLAESLSALSFYIEAVEQRRPNRERLIEPMLARRSGAPFPEAQPESDTVEAAVADLKAALPDRLAAFQRAPDDAAARERLATELATLKDDAALLADDRLQAHAGAALDELNRAREGDTGALQEAIGAIAGASEAEPAPAPSEETMRLMGTATSEFDRELLDIYLAEATEVLDSVAASEAVLRAHRDDRAALVTVRRGFHTLKGSGRMVGLTELGDLAYEVEKIHNRLLEEDIPVTPAVLAMIDVAQTSFRGWVETLQRSGRVIAEAAGLHEAIAKVESEFPEREVLTSAPAVVTPTQSSPAAGTEIEVLELDETPQEEAPRDDSGPMHTAEVIEFTPKRGLPRPPEEPAAAPPSAEAEEVSIGNVTLSAALFRILCDEAQHHLATLENEFQRLETDDAAIPSQAMVRAGHTLCGIHRTGGFPIVAATAKALEQCLLGLQERGGTMPSPALPVIGRAIAGLRALAGCVQRREAFTSIDETEAAEITAELETLRQETTSESASGDSETVAARVAQADDEATQPVASVHPEAFKGLQVVASSEQLGRFEKPAESEEPVAFAGAETPSPAVDVPPTTVASASVHADVPKDSLIDVRDDVDAQVLPIFLEEAAELFPQAGEQLRAWRERPSDADAAHALKRSLHTFKGSARMAGAMRLGELSHLMESRLAEGEALTRPTPALFDALDSDLDHIAFVLDRLQKGEFNTSLPWLESEKPEEVHEEEEAAPATELRSATVTPLPVSPPPVARAELAAAPAALEGEGARAMLRVRAELIDRLVNEAGEVAIARARVEGELRALKANLLELTSSVIRLRSQVREIEIQAESQIQSRMSMVNEAAEGFDPLEFDRFTRFQELTRGIAEGVNDVATVQQSLLKNLDEADAALLAQARLSRDVQQQLFSIRTVPFGSLSERLYRILRQTAKELDKRANLEIHGTQVELDRSVLEKLVAPLEHLLRNALGHGIESSEARRAAGKPETGEISLNVRQQGNEIAIELADDGAGLDFAKIAEKARALGVIPVDVEPTETRLIQCIFTPGFSTASKVTPISGRGVGMDVVRSDIAALGGRVDVTTRAGKGTTFTLYLPLTLAVAQAVLVKAGGRLWALPAPMVEQVQQIKDKELINLYLTREVVWQNHKYPFFYLPRLLGEAARNPETTRYNPVLLLRSGQHVTAVHVDEMIGNQEVVVKNIGPQLARVSGIAGATVLGTGEVVLIINPVQLAARADAAASDAPMVVKTAKAAAAAAAAAAAIPMVMIVDDSLTVRKIAARLLMREGFDVLTAKDGLDALQLIGQRTPDAILLDIEMPRMDGFEFAKTVKADINLAHIPIIMITSRTAEKHRARARELGVEVYLGKPYQEEELLRSLREQLALHAA